MKNSSAFHFNECGFSAHIPSNKYVLNQLFACVVYAWLVIYSYSAIKWYFNIYHFEMFSTDHLRNRQNFDPNKSRQKFHHSLKEHHKISNIPKFRC